MTTRRKSHFDLWDLIQKNIVYILGIVGLVFAFYYQTNSTLQKHDDGLKKLGEEFNKFGENSKSQFAEWLKINKSEEEKRERIAKEDREAREKVRDDFNKFVVQLTANITTTGTKVENITKALDDVTRKIDGISTIQQENRIIQRQGQGKAR